MTEAEILEYQESIIEWQRIIIGELLGQLGAVPQFTISEEMLEQIREVNWMYEKLNRP